MVDIRKIIPFITIGSNIKDNSNITLVNDDIVFLFEIDDILYKQSKNMRHDLMMAYKKIYKMYKSFYPNIDEFYKVIYSSNTYNESFEKKFNKTPGEIEDLKNFKYSDYIEDDKNLRTCLENLEYKLYCFTNDTKSKAEQILNKLGILNCFEGVICKDDKLINHSKDKKEPFLFVEKVLNIKRSSNVYFFTSSLKNRNVGLEMKWNSFYLNENKSIIDFLSTLEIK